VRCEVFRDFDHVVRNDRSYTVVRTYDRANETDIHYPPMARHLLVSISDPANEKAMTRGGHFPYSALHTK
jgi:hypothetical protein